MCRQREPLLAWDERGKNAPGSGLVCIVYGNYCPASFNPLTSYHTLSPQFLCNLLITACRSPTGEAGGQRARPQHPTSAEGTPTQALGRGQQGKPLCKDFGGSVIFRHTEMTYAGNVRALKTVVYPNSYSTSPAIHFSTFYNATQSSTALHHRDNPTPVTPRWLHTRKDF